MPNPFVHIELNTDDVAKAKQFYKAVFAWKLEDMPMGPGMTYTMLDVGKGVGGGMQAKPMPQAPTQWLPYVEVADVKATLQKAAAAGAQVVAPYMEIGEMGAIGVFVDPTGAGIGVWQTVKKPARARKPAKKAAKKATKKSAKKRR
ncbi:MAG: VOC family protein [Deltaproteobacteria bacterium]|nr:VOC family protein [Deltaproteobacteria bacterium]